MGYENIIVWESCTIGDILWGLNGKITHSHFQVLINVFFFLSSGFFEGKKCQNRGIKLHFCAKKWGKNAFWVNGVNPKSLVAPLVMLDHLPKLLIVHFPGGSSNNTNVENGLALKMFPRLVTIVLSLAGRSHDAPHSSGTILQDLAAHNSAKIRYLLCTFLVCWLNANFFLKFHWAEALLQPTPAHPVWNVVLWKKAAAGLLGLSRSSNTKSSPLAGHHPTPNHQHYHYAAKIHQLQGRRQVCLHKVNFWSFNESSSSFQIYEGVGMIVFIRKFSEWGFDCIQDNSVAPPEGVHHDLPGQHQ